MVDGNYSYAEWHAGMSSSHTFRESTNIFRPCRGMIPIRSFNGQESGTKEESQADARDIGKDRFSEFADHPSFRRFSSNG